MGVELASFSSEAYLLNLFLRELASLLNAQYAQNTLLRISVNILKYKGQSKLEPNKKQNWMSRYDGKPQSRVHWIQSQIPIKFNSKWETLVSLESRHRLSLTQNGPQPKILRPVLVVMQGPSVSKYCRALSGWGWAGWLKTDLKFIDLAPILLCRVKLWKHNNKTVNFSSRSIYLSKAKEASPKKCENSMLCIHIDTDNNNKETRTRWCSRTVGWQQLMSRADTVF